MIVTKEILIILAVVLLVCLLGFKKYIWFISIGYGLSIFVIGIMLLIFFGKALPGLTIAYCIIMACYGLRLGGFLIFREARTDYNLKMKTEVSDGSHMPIGAKIMLWVSCAILYVMMMSPLIYRCTNAVGVNACEITGIILAILGIVLEAAADFRKNSLKRANPGTFCCEGIFKLVRCPNYLGELILWTGVFISAFGALKGIGQWIVAILGYMGIVYIMFSGARRLEIRQDKNYGNDPRYIRYKESTPIIIPLVPLYSVKHLKWLVG